MSNDIGIFNSLVPSPVPSSTGRRVERPAPVEAVREVRRLASEDEKGRDTSGKLEQAVSALNNLVHDLHRELRFSVDHDSGDTVVKVVDRETEEVLRQIPSEDVMRLRRRLQEAAGVIFQDSA